MRPTHLASFKDISTPEVVNSIREQGFYFCENFLSDEYVDHLLGEVDFDHILINHNDVGVVTAGSQKFLTHCLAKSKKAYDLVTAPKVLEICNSYFTERYRLTNHRFCQTRGGFHMPWHTDNNLQVGSRLAGKHAMPGLLFLVYLSDQNRSPFQYIKDSHNWSQKYDHEIYLSDRWVDTHYQDEVLSFEMTKGSLIVCDTHGIHRAAPFVDRQHIRNILLFQVDQVGDRYVGHGEQNLIDTEFIDNLSPEVFDYLGFGVKRDYPAFPNSSVATMPIQELLNLQKRLLPLTVKAFAKNLVKALVPGSMMVEVKRAIWNLRQQRRR
jgi:Phytanoyl-CoA dioxygenase (PhyH)